MMKAGVWRRVAWLQPASQPASARPDDGEQWCQDLLPAGGGVSKAHTLLCLLLCVQICVVSVCVNRTCGLPFAGF